MRISALKTSALTAVLLGSAIALASPGMSPALHPAAFCPVAADLGFPTRPYNHVNGACGSEMTPVTPSSLPHTQQQNNLAFYSMADLDDPTKLKRVSFILNVSVLREAVQARAELARVAGIAAMRIVGFEPPDLASNIKAGASRTWRTGQWTIELITHTWPRQPGHDITVRFIPT